MTILSKLGGGSNTVSDWWLDWPNQGFRIELDAFRLDDLKTSFIIVDGSISTFSCELQVIQQIAALDSC